MYLMGGYLSVLLYPLQTLTRLESQMFLTGPNMALFWAFLLILLTLALCKILDHVVVSAFALGL